MGRDKAMVMLEGRTLLGRAVDILRAVDNLKPERIAAGASEATERPSAVTPVVTPVVTIVGQRTELEGADRVVADRYLGCGPLGGIEAALLDLESRNSENRDLESKDLKGRDSERRDFEQHRGADWAFFIPVDMPFLPAALLDAMLQEWTDASQRGAHVCYVTVDGTPQPLVSMIHRSLRPSVTAALEEGHFKVTPVLQSACDSLAFKDVANVASKHSVGLHETLVSRDELTVAKIGWTPTGAQMKTRQLWFSNLNDVRELRETETFLTSAGSTG